MVVKKKWLIEFLVRVAFYFIEIIDKLSSFYVPI
jgi:hypothetical protein